VALVSVPHGKGRIPTRVKQYVDGHLESANIKPAKKGQPSGGSVPADAICLGRDMEGHDHSRGKLDELFAADQAVSVPELKQLIIATQLTPTSTKPN
jgi:hypothetical protein